MCLDLNRNRERPIGNNDGCFVYSLVMPVRGRLGTLWAQFRHKIGTNDLEVL